ncbi:MAG TPA: C25 family cysteine peptidase, partial [Candidatus Thermoplasmatota archaeon]|nr:C25 family cysteine peptidase [Candidatus Thermoplasmatota archaeon]
MKKILPILLVGVLLISGFGAAVSVNTQKNQLFLQQGVSFSEPVLTDHDNYLSVEIAEATSLASSPGNPMLPLYTKLFSFPFGTIIKDVSFTASSEQIIRLTKEILPGTQPTPVSGGLMTSSNQKQVKNEAVYSGKAMYPASRLEYQVGAGLQGNEHVTFLSVLYYPLLYQPQQYTLLFTPNAQITITYEEPQQSKPLSTETKLLIIAPEEFSAALQPLIDHKNQYNVSTTLITTEWVADHSTGRDLPEQIKYAIKDEIETNAITSVLLVGSFDKLPMRRSYVSLWGDWDEEMITDLYYSDIYDGSGNFCSWDSNNNDQFGEASDHVDLFPDVHLGRLACDTLQDVTIVVDKIIHYETETYGSDWFNTMIYIGGNTFRWSPGNDGEEINQIIMGIMPQFSPETIWTSKGNFNRRTISNAITAGAGFLDYSGHGFENGMGTYTPAGVSMKYYYSAFIKDTQNGYKLPIIFFDACLTAKIDYVLQDLLDYRSYAVFNV